MSVKDELAQKYGTPQKPDYSSVEAYKESMKNSVEAAVGSEQHNTDAYELALDLSPERFGSEPVPKGADQTFYDILAEAERIKQVKSDAKYIAREIIKELDKREAAKEAAETVPETIPVETVEVIVVQEPEPDYTIPVVSSACGFVIGVLVASLFFLAKIKHIRKEHEMW